MDITITKDYVKDTLVSARATLKRDLSIVIAEESFYGFVGKNSMYTMDTLIYEEDLQKFLDAFTNDDKTPLYIRVKRGDETYRWCQFTLIDSEVLINGEYYYEIELRDLISVNARYSYMDKNLSKYRNLLTVVRERYFEYEMDTNILKIYIYRDNRADLLELDDLDDWKKKLIKFDWVNRDNQVALEQLCSNIKAGMDSIQVSFESSFLKKGESSDIVTFRGQTMYYNGKKNMVVGLIELRKKNAVVSNYYSSLDSNKDSATGLLNKKAMTDYAISRTNLYRNQYLHDLEKNLHMVIIDIDYFKNVNDTYGHMFGDEVIQKFASMLKHIVGERGMVGRIGGDEFFILLEGVQDREALRLILKTIRKRMFYAFPNMSPAYVFTCSIGVSQFRKDANDYETLFRLADKALYIAKEKGRDRFVIYDIEKHGPLTANEESESIMANRTVTIKPFDKMKMSAGIFELLTTQGADAVKECMDILIENLNIHAISIYLGKDMKHYMTGGVYPKEIPDMKCIYEDNYLSKFNELAMRVINNIEGISVEHPNVYKVLSEAKVCSALQFIIGDLDDVKGMICIDILGDTKRKWSDNDISLLYLIVDFMGNRILESLDK